jgi:hypothetical protein
MPARRSNTATARELVIGPEEAMTNPNGITPSKVIAAALVVSAILSASLGTPPVADASPDLYLNEVRSTVRAPLSDQEALSLGNVACDAMRAALADGLTMGEARHKADQAVGWGQHRLRNGGMGLTEADGMHLVDAADQQLC